MSKELAVLVGALVGAAIGAPIGRRSVRQNIRLEQRLLMVAELQTRFRKLRRDFQAWTAPPEHRLDEDPSRLEQSRRISRKLDSLRTYYEAQERWLKRETSDAASSIIDGYGLHFFHLSYVLEANATPGAEDADPNVPYDEDLACAPVYAWATQDRLGDLSSLLRRFDEVERGPDGHPWRQKLLGELIQIKAQQSRLLTPFRRWLSQLLL